MALTDDLFQAVDTIVSSRLTNLPYDQTIECEITAVDSNNKNRYTVLYQKAKFDAYSTGAEYEVGDTVYVNVPQGNFTENKFIISKKQKEVRENIKGLPFFTFLKGPNYLEENYGKEYIIHANNDFREYELIKSFVYEDDELNYPLTGGYTKLGVKCAFYSDIIDDMISGDYGIKITISGYDLSKTTLDMTNAIRTGNPIIRELYLRKADMVGASIYNTFGFCNQEKVFDITNFIINTLKVELFQDKNFKTLAGRIPEKLIKVRNLLLYLGYDVNDYPNPYGTYAILYTDDGLAYNPQVMSKKIYARIINRIPDSTDYLIKSSYFTDQNVKNLYSYIWEKYNMYVDTVSKYSSKKGFEDIYINSDIPENAKNYNQIVNMSTARNRTYTSFIFTLAPLGDYNTNNYLVSNELLFINAAYLEDSSAIDLIIGFLASAVESDDPEAYNGKYFIYGQDSRATDLTAVSTKHYIYLKYNSLTEEGTREGLRPGDEITAVFPALDGNTMIRCPAAKIDTTTNLPTFYHILDESDLDAIEKIYKVPYYIDNYYSPSKINNTIEFSMIRDGISFKTSCELLFGTSGSQGSEYSLRIILKQNDEPIYTIPVGNHKDNNNETTIHAELEVYDYANKLILLDNNYKLKWSIILREGIGNNEKRITIDEDTGYIDINTNNMNELFVTPGVVCATLTKKVIGDNATTTLYSYFPLAFCIGNKSINANGITLLTYDITGKKPLFIKTSFKLDSTQYNNINWNIMHNNTTIQDPDYLAKDPNYVWKPILTNNDELVGPSVYVTNSNKVIYSLVAIQKINNEDTVIWYSPIYMFLHKYPNASEYEELNLLKIIEETKVNGVTTIDTYTVVNTLAGRVVENNQKINGVFLGTLKKSNYTSDSEKLGLYAFHENTPFLEITEDGYIFFNGITSNESESGGIVITDAWIYSSTFDDGIIINPTLKGTLKLNEDNSPITFATNDGTAILSISDTVIVANEIILGTITTANLAVTADYAVTADKLDDSAGTETKPVYFNNGVPVLCSEPLTLKATTALTAEKLGTNAGESTKPVYFNNGIPVLCSEPLTLKATTALTAEKLGTNAGTSTKPVYFDNGIPVLCSEPLSLKATTANYSNTANFASTAGGYSSNGNIASKFESLSQEIENLRSEIESLRQRIH